MEKSQEERWLLHEKFHGIKTDEFYTDCKALAMGTPLGYLIGHVPFLNCTIHLDNQPLIPRVETEFWVDQAIATIKEAQTIQTNLFTEQAQYIDQTTSILDLCAGSGCIGVAVATSITDCLVDFGELSERLLPTIRKNCVANQIAAERFTIYHSNVLQQIPPHKKYDFILTNPPYIDPTIDRATESVKSHEPHLALYGGDAGLEVISAIITKAPSYLTLTGQLWIEHEPEQAGAISKLATTVDMVSTSYTDQYGVVRYSVLVLQ